MERAQMRERIVPSEKDLAALYALDSIRGFGPQPLADCRHLR
jgi:hypothetical protein